jgi:hypothetical protein
MVSFTGLAWEFVVQILSGVVAVFVGIWLALIVERRRREEDSARQHAEQQCEFDRTIDMVLGSVVKNTAEAKRILRLLDSPRCSRLIHSGLETAKWDATQDTFMALCGNVDQRVIFAQFFDDVRRLRAFLDFRCNLQVSIATARLERGDPQLQGLATDVDQQLAGLAEDLRFCGVLLVTDHGKPVHKRLMGIGLAAAGTTSATTA